MVMCDVIIYLTIFACILNSRIVKNSFHAMNTKAITILFLIISFVFLIFYIFLFKKEGNANND